MTVRTEVQNTLARTCGDRRTTGDYEPIVDTLDYECATGSLSVSLNEAANMLRSDEMIVPLLRLRIADLKTRMAELNTFNPAIERGLRDIADRFHKAGESAPWSSPRECHRSGIPAPACRISR